MQLGISSYTFTWSIGVPGYDRPDTPMDASALLRTAAEHGLHLVQIADNMPLHSMDGAELDRLSALAREWGIRLEVGTRGTEPGLLLTYLELARRLDARLCRTLITTEDMEEACRDLSAVLPAFEAAGIILAVENHGLHTTEQLAGLFRRLHSPMLGCCLDTVNSFGALESPDQVTAALAPFTANLHLKDFDIRRSPHMMGYEVTGTAAGDGRLRIPDTIGTVASLGRPGTTAILELWTPYMDSVEATIRLEQEWFGRSLAYLSKHLEF